MIPPLIKACSVVLFPHISGRRFHDPPSSIITGIPFNDSKEFKTYVLKHGTLWTF